MARGEAFRGKERSFSSVVFPIAIALGISPVHLGVMATINIELATITPPVGMNLYAISGLAKVPITTVLRGAAPFAATIFAWLMLSVWFPGFITYLPSIVYGG